MAPVLRRHQPTISNALGMEFTTFGNRNPKAQPVKVREDAGFDKLVLGQLGSALRKTGELNGR
jgi:hypothetical protein